MAAECLSKLRLRSCFSSRMQGGMLFNLRPSNQEPEVNALR